ncbi:MAG: hypothetical protein ACTSSE_16020 [Candidatus Thorarchaeota archaeon]
MSMCDWCKIGCALPEENYGEYCDMFKAKRMPIISFGHTSPPFVAQEKSVTRRNWTERHARIFKEGKICKAYSKGPQYGGECIGIIKITETPFKQHTDDMTPMDYRYEGFEYLDQQNKRITGEEFLLRKTFDVWRFDNISYLSVVPFEILEVFPGMLERYTTDEEIIKAVKALQKAIG